jgi:cephalosporin hydroxylase
MDHFYHTIPGHCDFWGLYLDQINRAPEDWPSVFVEVGTWRGCSLAFLAVQAWHSGKTISIIGVDGFEASPDTHMSQNAANGDFPTLESVQEHFTQLPSVRLIKALSWDAATQFEDESVDFVFIDAAHDFESVAKDIEAWYPKVRRGGTLAGHDYTYSYPGVIAAVHQKFGPVRRIVSSWVVEKSC